jgi:serine/threonine-protein kinase
VVKLLDFGLVQQTRIGAAAGAAEGRTIAGTPLFMCPEQAVGGEVSRRSDVYSLGAVAFVLVTGRPPFPEENLARAIIAHTNTPVTPPSQFRPEISADLEMIIMRCLEKNPNERFQTAADLEQSLSECECADRWTQQRAAAWWRHHGFVK